MNNRGPMPWARVGTFRRRDLRAPARAAGLCVLGCVAVSVTRARAAETGRLFVKSTPSGAQVFVDDEKEPRGKTPCILRNVPAGGHVLRAHLEGYADVSQEIEVEAGSLGRASLVFTVKSGEKGEPGPGEAVRTVVVSRGREPEAPVKKKPATTGGSSDSGKPERYIHVDCPVCAGTGLLQEMGCPACLGTGLVGANRCAECGGSRKIEHDCRYCKGAGVVTRGGEEKDCSKCKGKGKPSCPVCRGKGKLRRGNPEFSAKPTITCPYCQGCGFESNVKCLRCAGRGTFISGDGMWYTKVSCPFCGGDGWGPPLCARCRGGGVIKASGRGMICVPCFGSGQIFRPCRRCRGNGWIHSK